LYHEAGDLYTHFFSGFFWLSQERRPFFSPSLVDTVRVAIYNVFGFKVVALGKKDLPSSAFINIKAPRYRADQLLKFLEEVRPDTIDFILGLTVKDISTTKKDPSGNTKKPASRYYDWGVCGLGYIAGPCSVVSTYRLKAKDEDLFLQRFKKTCVHELGHNLGLPHCEYDDKCVLRDAAETVRAIDHVDLWLCDQCKKKLGIGNKIPEHE